MKKVKGVNFILDKKEKNIYTLNRNAVYHYRFPELKLLNTFKSLSNISYLLLSEEERQIAVVNTSGTIAVHLAESGELLGKSRMEKTETFFSCYLDNDWILCADCGGKIMRMNTKNFAHEILLDLKYFEREFRPRLMLN